MRVDLSKTALSIVAVISMFTQAGWAEDNSSSASTEYQTSGSMDCGPTNVHVVTYCEFGKDQNPDCFLQKVVFTNLKTKRTSSKFYLYENYKKDMSLIVQLVCVKKWNGTGIVLESTNLGNCSGCEWDDYFDNVGVFLGSSRTMFGATNFKPNPVADTFYDKQGFVLDPRGRFVELARVWVDRENRK